LLKIAHRYCVRGDQNVPFFATWAIVYFGHLRKENVAAALLVTLTRFGVDLPNAECRNVEFFESKIFQP
jgi:hypothetical protein